MSILICPGIHAPQLTHSFLEQLLAALAPQTLDRRQLWVYPTQTSPAFSGTEILKFLHDRLVTNRAHHPIHQTPILVIAFSAGVVGAIAAAQIWRQQGGTVKALIACDGWGVPLWGDFPIHRLSHDAFTHWSSALLGAGANCFYADPAIAHLDLWRSPQTAHGWQLFADSTQPACRTTAVQFLAELLRQYGAVGTCANGLD